MGLDAYLGQYAESVSPAPAAFTGNPTFTAEAVVQVVVGPQPNQYPPFLLWGTGSDGKAAFFGLSFSADKIYVGFYGSGQQLSGTISRQRWYHVVWVRDSAGGSAAGTSGNTLYINGAPVGLEPQLPSTPPIALSATPFRVSGGEALNRFFSGAVDEVALYDRALSAAEVQAHYKALTVLCQADFNGDGKLDILDFAAFQNAFAIGCP